MKIILLQDVPGAGRKGEVKVVSNGYAMNFLFPRKLAQAATAAAMAKIESERGRIAAEMEMREKLLGKSLEALSGAEIVLKKKAAPEGHLFAGIHAEEIAQALKDQKQIEIPPEFIPLEKPLKALGEYPLTLKGGGKKSTFTLKIEGVE